MKLIPDSLWMAGCPNAHRSAQYCPALSQVAGGSGTPACLHASPPAFDGDHDDGDDYCYVWSFRPAAFPWCDTFFLFFLGGGATQTSHILSCAKNYQATLFKICSLSLVKISLSVKMLASSHKQWFALVTWSWSGGGGQHCPKRLKKHLFLWIASLSVEQETGEAWDKLDHLPGHRRATNFVFPGSTSLITNCRHQLYEIGEYKEAD